MGHEKPSVGGCRVTRSLPDTDLYAHCRHDPDLVARLERAAVVVLPISTAPSVLFPSDTAELLQELQARLGEKNVAIAIRDEDYSEWLLHGFLVDLGAFVVAQVMLPLTLTVLWDYVKYRTGIFADTKVRVRMQITSGDPSGGRLEVECEGTSEEVQDFFEQRVLPLMSAAGTPIPAPGLGDGRTDTANDDA